MSLYGRDFLSIQEWSTEELEQVLTVAADFVTPLYTKTSGSNSFVWLPEYQVWLPEKTAAAYR